MRLPFLNRENEKRRLQRLLRTEEGMFACVYGRRRTGKSRLLQEVLPRKNTVYFVCDEREAPLQREAAAVAMASVVPDMDQVRYPDWASLLDRWWKAAPPGSVLALDEFPYLVKASPEVPSLLQKLIDHHSARGLHLLVCGSSQRMMQGLLLEASAPLFGRAREIIEVKPLDAGWIRTALQLKCPFDALQAFSIWGGIPRYWELAAEYSDLWEAVEELVLDPMGVLHHEPTRLLLDDMRDTAQAISILVLIGGGCHRMSEIAGRLGKPATSLVRPLQRLLDLGLIARELPFGDSEKSGKRRLYQIADPFLSFWFRYVEPARSRLESGFVHDTRATIQRDFPNYVSFAWERLVRRAFPKLRLGSFEWLPARRWWGAGTDRRPLEIDVVAESADRKTLFVGEVKLSADSAAFRAAHQELDEKSTRLPFVASHQRVMTGVFVADSRRQRKTTGLITGKDVISACI